MENLTRILFLLGLVPTALLALGAVAAVRDVVRRWLTDRDAGSSQEGRDGSPEAGPATALLLLTAAGYLAFVALYSVRVRDYSTMKQIFVLPALLGFVALTAKGIDLVAEWSAGERRRAFVSRAAITGVFLVALANAVDVALLIRDLSVRPGQPRTAPQSRAPGGADSYGSEDEQPDKPGSGVTAPSPATQPRAALR